MGIARLYLSLCVVAAHSTALVPWPTHGGAEAVQIFFMISGFYMALIAGKYESKREFYASRFLRIYIPYYAVCLGILLCSVAAGISSGKWLQLSSYSTWSEKQNGIGGFAFAALSNLSIFGADWTQFLSDEPGNGIQWTDNFHKLPHPLSNYLLIPPAWSVGVELVFYVLVPFLNRLRTRWLVGVLGIALAGRFATYEFVGLNWDPWTYRFMPFEISQFLLGMLSYRLHQHFQSSHSESVSSKGGIQESWYSRLQSGIGKWDYPLQLCAALVVFWLTYESIRLMNIAGISMVYARLVSYLLWFLILPILFASTASNRVDRVLGDLSYPIYLTHYFVVGLIGAVSTRIAFSDWLRGPLTACISILLSLLLMFLITEPLEKRRRNLARRIALGRSKKPDQLVASESGT